jgi:hypothetical protein
VAGTESSPGDTIRRAAENPSHDQGRPLSPRRRLYVISWRARLPPAFEPGDVPHQVSMSLTDTSRLSPRITPAGHLLAARDVEAPALHDDVALGAAFRRGAGHGLLYPGSATIGRALPPAWAWWRDLGAPYVTSLYTAAEGGEIAVAQPDPAKFGALIEDAPPMMGAEYLTPDVLAALWGEIDGGLRD